MLEAALKYPFRGEDSTERLVIGGALPFLGLAIYFVGLLLTLAFVGFLILPFSIVPQIFLWGYLVAVLGGLLAGRDELPAFDNWKRLGIDGLKAILVSIGYSLPMIVLLVIFVTVVAIADVSTGPATGTSITMLSELVAMGTVLVAVLYSLALYYVLPAAIVNFVREDDLAAAFHLRTVKEIVLTSDYLVAWLLAAVVVLVGSIVAFPLYFVLVGFVLEFYTMVVAAYLVTHGTMDAAGWTAPTGERASEFLGESDESGGGSGGRGGEWDGLTPAVVPAEDRPDE